jgi:hypothetical protein
MNTNWSIEDIDAPLFKTCQIDSGFGHLGRQFRDEVDRLEDDVSGAIPVGRFQLVPNLALVRQ